MTWQQQRLTGGQQGGGGGGGGWGEGGARGRPRKSRWDDGAAPSGSAPAEHAWGQQRAWEATPAAAPAAHMTWQQQQQQGQGGWGQQPPPLSLIPAFGKRLRELQQTPPALRPAARACSQPR